jgi:hypothetical protein
VRTYSRTFRPVAWLVILLGVGGVFLGPDARPASFGAVAGGLCLVLIPNVFKGLVVRQYRKNPSAAGEIHYEFGQDSVRIVSAAGQSDLQWRAFLKRKLTPGFLRLHATPDS